jgi:tetratricopeptide (TPR) repeat protein
MVSRIFGLILLLAQKLADPRWLVAMLLASLPATLYLQHYFDPWRQYQLGLKALAANDIPGATQAAEALDGIPAYVSHKLYLTAALALRQGDVKAALENAIAASENPDIAVDANVLAGEAAYKVGAAGNAKLYWEASLRSDPECVPAHQWLGALYYDLGAMDAAILHLSTVARLVPTDARPDRLMGLMNHDYERPEVAIPHYQESLRRAPNQPSANDIRLEMAGCQIKLREFTAALATLEKCKPSPEKGILTARCMLNIGELEEARHIAIELLNGPNTQSSFFDALQINAEIALADGKIDDAIALLRNATEVDPFDHGARTQLAQVLGRSGQTEAAREQTQRAEELQKLWQRFSDLQIDAINRATDAPVRYEIGSLAKQLGKPELAISWFKAALAIDPSLKVAADALADAMQSATTETPKP